MKEWITAIITEKNRYEIVIDSSTFNPFIILRNNKPLPNSYSTIWNAIRAMKCYARHETVIEFHTSTIDQLEDVTPQLHWFFVKHYLTGKYKA